MADFTNEELSAVNSTLFERYKKSIDIALADSELRLDPHSPGDSAVSDHLLAERRLSFCPF